MRTIETMPGLYRQTKPERLDRIGIPLGWVRSVESLRAYGKNLTMLLGTSGTGRDTLIDAIQKATPEYQRIRRVTTRPYREPNESQRILSISADEFNKGVACNTIVCPYLYPANKSWYGISIEEMNKLQERSGIIESTCELIPLKILLPQAKLLVVLPENLAQVEQRLQIRDSACNESMVRFRQTTRELCSLTLRLPDLIEKGVVDGVIVNSGPIEKVASQTTLLLQGENRNFSIPDQLTSDIQNYLSSWSKNE